MEVSNESNSQWSAIVRLDEKQKNLEEDIRELKNAISKLADSVGANYVRKEEFSPVQKVVFATISVILTSVVAAAIGAVVIVK